MEQKQLNFRIPSSFENNLVFYIFHTALFIFIIMLKLLSLKLIFIEFGTVREVKSFVSM